MVKNDKWVWVILSLILIFILGFFLGRCKDKPIPITENPDVFPRDTVFVRIDSFIHDTVVGPYIPVKPNPKTEYDKPLPDKPAEIIYRDSTVLVYLPDTLLAQYSRRFLVNEPTSPKLLRARIGGKLISFDFLKPNGYPESFTYPLDLQNYSYTWEHGKMKATALPKDPNPLIKLPKANFQAEAFSTFNPARKTARMGLEGTIYIGRLGITAYSSYTTGNSTPNFDIGTGLKVRLTK